MSDPTLRALKIPLKDAQSNHVCRLCGGAHDLAGPFGPAMPFMLAFGEEFAHLSCLEHWDRDYKDFMTIKRIQRRRDLLRDRCGRLWRDPIATRVLLAWEMKAQRLLERLRARRTKDRCFPFDYVQERLV